MKFKQNDFLNECARKNFGNRAFYDLKGHTYHERRVSFIMLGFINNFDKIRNNEIFSKLKIKVTICEISSL